MSDDPLPTRLEIIASSAGWLAVGGLLLLAASGVLGVCVRVFRWAAGV